MQLGLNFQKDWEIAVCEGAPSALMRKGRSNNNALQFSFNQNIEKKKIEPTIDLEPILHDLVGRLGGQLLRSFRGSCDYGRFASGIFSANAFSHCQVWCVTNEIHIITATFICDAPPTDVELREVEGMVMSLRLVPDAVEPSAPAEHKDSRWQFWRRRR